MIARDESYPVVLCTLSVSQTFSHNSHNVKLQLSKP